MKQRRKSKNFEVVLPLVTRRQLGPNLGRTGVKKTLLLVAFCSLFFGNIYPFLIALLVRSGSDSFRFDCVNFLGKVTAMLVSDDSEFEQATKGAFYLTAFDHGIYVSLQKAWKHSDGSRKSKDAEKKKPPNSPSKVWASLNSVIRFLFAESLATLRQERLAETDEIYAQIGMHAPEIVNCRCVLTLVCAHLSLRMGVSGSMCVSVCRWV